MWVRARPLPHLSYSHSATPVPAVGLTPELEVAMVRHAILWDHCTPLCCLPACP